MHIENECLFKNQLKKGKKKQKEQSVGFQIIDDEVNDKINENIVKGSL